MENAKKAVIEIHEEYLSIIKGQDISMLQHDSEFKEKSTALAIAFHNVGVEEEYF